MGEIAFRQYVLPDGRQKDVTIDRPDHVSKKAQKIIDAGYRFECEILTNGMVSVTIHDPQKGDDVDIRVVMNGPQVPKAIDKMIMGFNP